MTTWFTADLHLGHSAVIRYCNRPFANADEMNAGLVARWNARVRDGDEVWLLGDVALLSPARARPIVMELRGRKHLVTGNHDRHASPALLGCFESVQPYKELRADGRLIVLCHYPLATWNKAHHGAWCLHGHSHGSYRPGRPDVFDGGRILDVGVDCHAYAPVSLDEVAEIMGRKQFAAVDHHGREADA